MNIKIIGREPDCDLVIDRNDVGGVQARLELSDDGRVYLLDAGSGINTYLNRNEQWIRIHKICLCIADRIRFGEYELPLPELLAVFGKRADIRLGDEHFSLHRHKSVRPNQRDSSSGDAKLQRPRRNPLTGKIEQTNSQQDGAPQTAGKK